MIKEASIRLYNPTNTYALDREMLLEIVDKRIVRFIDIQLYNYELAVDVDFVSDKSLDDYVRETLKICSHVVDSYPKDLSVMDFVFFDEESNAIDFGFCNGYITLDRTLDSKKKQTIRNIKGISGIVDIDGSSVLTFSFPSFLLLKKFISDQGIEKFVNKSVFLKKEGVDPKLMSEEHLLNGLRNPVAESLDR